MLRKKIGDRVRALRKAHGYSQQKLGEMAGISWQHIGTVERAEAACTVDVLEKLIKALGCTPGQLLAYDEVEAAREVHDLLEELPEKARPDILGAMRHVILAVRASGRESSGRRRA